MRLLSKYTIYIRVRVFFVSARACVCVFIREILSLCMYLIGEGIFFLISEYNDFFKYESQESIKPF